MNVFRVLLWIGLILPLCSCDGELDTTKPAATQQRSSHTVSGRVVTQGNGVPSEVIVRLVHSEMADGRVSAEGGIFEFSDVPDGEFALAASSPGWRQLEPVLGSTTAGAGVEWALPLVQSADLEGLLLMDGLPLDDGLVTLSTHDAELLAKGRRLGLPAYDELFASDSNYVREGAFQVGPVHPEVRYLLEVFAGGGRYCWIRHGHELSGAYVELSLEESEPCESPVLILVFDADSGWPLTTARAHAVVEGRGEEPLDLVYEQNAIFGFVRCDETVRVIVEAPGYEAQTIQSGVAEAALFRECKLTPAVDDGG